MEIHGTHMKSQEIICQRKWLLISPLSGPASIFANNLPMTSRHLSFFIATSSCRTTSADFRIWTSSLFTRYIDTSKHNQGQNRTISLSFSERTPKDFEHISLGLPGVLCCDSTPASFGNTKKAGILRAVNVLSNVPSTTQGQVVLLVISFHGVCAQD